MLAYICFNLGESATIEKAGRRKRFGTTESNQLLVVAGPPPLIFWERNIQWRSAGRYGSGEFSPGSGLQLDLVGSPLGLDDPRLMRAAKSDRHARAFLVWSRMPIVVETNGHAYLSDQRFYGPLHSAEIPAFVRNFFRTHSFLVPLDKR